jgi:lysophospholipase L1-like esterase
VRRATALAVITLLVAGAGGCSSAPAAGPVPGSSSYYVSLGDSLSQGVQPDAAGVGVRTSDGYADQLYAVLRRGDPGLRLVKLGCPGETTGTMINGGLCQYPGGSQLAAAAGFLRGHRGQVTLITIDIGSNDLTADLAACQTRSSLAAIVSCLRGSIPHALANLTKIMCTLRGAAGSRAGIIGMTYYVPQLSQWLDGPGGQEQARRIEALVLDYNELLSGIYRRYGAGVADVFGAFHSTDFSGHVTLPGLGAVPPNVAAICRWTWACAAPPRGPNVHADTAGYQVIAQAFVRAAAAIRVKSATPSDSPRSDGSTPAADSTSSARDGLPAQDASAARRVLRRCANAASITANVSSRPAPAGGSRLVSATSPESTRGTGQNTVRGTCPAFRTRANQASLTDGEP